MTNGDYFFLFFLGTIAFTRILLAFPNMGGPTIMGLRIRHYMPGILIVVFAFLFSDLILYGIGLGLVADEIPVILAKGPGHKDEYWRGCKDYHTSWSVAGVLILVFVTFILRNYIAGLI